MADHSLPLPDFPPLVPPTGWPPYDQWGGDPATLWGSELPMPPRPPKPKYPTIGRYVPIVGSVLARLLYRWRCSEWRSSFHDSLEADIVRQMEQRPPLQRVERPTPEQEVLEILAIAACEEKGIMPARPVHPQDLFDLHIWDAYDNITGLLIQIGLEESSLRLRSKVEFREILEAALSRVGWIALRFDPKGPKLHPSETITVAEFVQMICAEAVQREPRAPSSAT